ncbi:HAMP domain-containing histidine kinase [Thiomicrorhabdus sediminis]|uniref:histidine kinase n=1 Tax=Thiomicrorhabdus sediminis TaxID=2580412 RepID=A0A4P9K3A4_9GAMM|nr:HAMP domain-containing histidine kinase [Thiomicrorhabdus sediminis]
MTSTISNLEKAQTQLIESEKLASLGGLVAGIAHEVNTPLGIGLTSSSLLREKVDHLKNQVDNKQLTQTGLNSFIDEANQTCQILENNLFKAADLITNFKQLAVDQSSDQSYTFNVYDSLQATKVSLNHILKKQGIHTHIECSHSLKMFGNSGILSQIITNLLTNSASHAFENDSEDKQIHIRAESVYKKLIVEYTDNGIGMPEDVVKKIYEPFFTTKRGKGGSGLGMNLVYNLVVQKLKGQIDIKTAPNEGTTFTIEIPFDRE